MKLLLQSACCLFAAFTAFADIVKMVPLDTFVDGTNAVLAAANAYTDAHGGVNTNAVRDIAREEVAPATNAVLSSAQLYTDAAVAVAFIAANAYTDTATNGLLRAESDPTVGLTNRTLTVHGLSVEIPTAGDAYCVKSNAVGEAKIKSIRFIGAANAKMVMENRGLVLPVLSYDDDYGCGAALGATANIGYFATAIGGDAKTIRYYDTALGGNATARGNSATAIGHRATADGYLATALGDNATATNLYSTALGGNATATSFYSTALGSAAAATNDYSTAIGWQARSHGDFTVNFGGTDNPAKIYFEDRTLADMIASGSGSAVHYADAAWSAVSNAAASVAAKQDRLPFATNAIPYSVIEDAPLTEYGYGWYLTKFLYSSGASFEGDVGFGSEVSFDWGAKSNGPIDFREIMEAVFPYSGSMYVRANRLFSVFSQSYPGNTHLYDVTLPYSSATGDEVVAFQSYVDAATNGLESSAHAAATYQHKGDYLTAHQSLQPATNYADAVASSVTSAVPSRLPAATIAAFNATLATNGIAALSASATLYDALDRLMQMAGRSSPGPATDAEIAVNGGAVWYELENGDTVFEFKTAASGQSFTVLANDSGYKADVLVVGGGGAGGGWFAGGGGGGSVTSVVDQVLTVGQPYEVTVGFGGRRREHIFSSGNEAAGGNGGYSAFVGDGIDLFAGGGGGGGAFQVAGVYYDGIANGGGRGADNKAPSYSPVRGGGFGGGGTGGGAGGGGGASDNGSGFAYNDADCRGWGREGVTNDITGVAQVYGSGGGGSVNSSLADAPNAGKGGTNAGDGCHADSIEGRDAVAGFGGGAGGGVSRYGSTGDPNGGFGGSGTVIVRVHGKCRVTGGIPDGYTILAGVNNSRSSTSAGTICDVTNYFANAATRIEADFYMISDTGNTQTLLCSRENSNNPNNNSFTLFAVTSGSGGSGWRFDCGPTAVTPSAAVPGTGWRHAVLDAASGTASVTTQSGASNPVAVPASPGMASPAPYPLRLFGSYSGTLTTVGNIANGWIIHRVRISEGGETVHDLWPCRRDADQANGFIDTVSGAFYPIKTAGAAMMMMMGRPSSVDDEFPPVEEFAVPDESAAPEGEEAAQ